MHTPMNNSYIIINTQILRENISAILGELPGQAALIPVLKDDAYGLGLSQVAKVLMAFPEVETLAISHVSEGVAIFLCWAVSWAFYCPWPWSMT